LLTWTNSSRIIAHLLTCLLYFGFLKYFFDLTNKQTWDESREKFSHREENETCGHWGLKGLVHW
jgi:hypothetical protein